MCKLVGRCPACNIIDIITCKLMMIHTHTTWKIDFIQLSSSKWKLRYLNMKITFGKHLAYVRRWLKWFCVFALICRHSIYMDDSEWKYTKAKFILIMSVHKFTINFLNENHFTALQWNCINLFMTSVYAALQQVLSDFITISLNLHSFEWQRNFIELNSFRKFWLKFDA